MTTEKVPERELYKEAMEKSRNADDPVAEMLKFIEEAHIQQTLKELEGKSDNREQLLQEETCPNLVQDDKAR